MHQSRSAYAPIPDFYGCGFASTRDHQRGASPVRDQVHTMKHPMTRHQPYFSPLSAGSVSELLDRPKATTHVEELREDHQHIPEKRRGALAEVVLANLCRHR